MFDDRWNYYTPEKLEQEILRNPFNLQNVNKFLGEVEVSVYFNGVHDCTFFRNRGVVVSLKRNHCLTDHLTILMHELVHAYYRAGVVPNGGFMSKSEIDRSQRIEDIVERTALDFYRKNPAFVMGLLERFKKEWGVPEEEQLLLTYA